MGRKSVEENGMLPEPQHADTQAEDLIIDHYPPLTSSGSEGIRGSPHRTSSRGQTLLVLMEKTRRRRREVRDQYLREV
ncbi:hypothetical protein NHX12_027823 [Muraenolepis orangiensis]|uniref:Uncharacterized protein n=1 Tax=Muraenolepis orangiensis TaxID=630683 RepID=A0A9Q0EEC6_9TELE|nr:hypothetical protein NHX12_027823 [Muraenolepis orangiensis]